MTLMTRTSDTKPYMPDETDYYDWLFAEHQDAFEEATGQLANRLRARGLTPDVARLREAVEECHTQDDPDWSFSISRLIEMALEACGTREIALTAVQFEAVESDIDEMFPLVLR